MDITEEISQARSCYFEAITKEATRVTGIIAMILFPFGCYLVYKVLTHKEPRGRR
jgi:hypothetical protein